jgi:hypothetical protein
MRAVTFLVLPFLGVADARFGLDVVPEHILGAFAVGPDVFTGQAAGVAPQAFIKIKNKTYLLFYLHRKLPSHIGRSFSWYITFFFPGSSGILRMKTAQSRSEGLVPQ